MTIRDRDVQSLASLSQLLRRDYEVETNVWEGSPFAWIKSRPSRQIGAIGEKLVSGWLAARGFNVVRSVNADADRVIEGVRMEIKFSTLWANGGYKFQQLRDQDYDAAICLGISPFDAQCWIIPKADIIRLWQVEGLISSQHGGKASLETAWIGLDPQSPPPWIQPYGGTLARAVEQLSRMTGFDADGTNLRRDR
jgi:hypothetical protein